MIHYHGGPITPDTCAIRAWQSRHAFISFAEPRQLGLAAEVSQSFSLDNGAFSMWKAGKVVDWEKFYLFVDTWRNHPRFDFAVVPDVIGGTEEENDALLSEWPFPKYLGAAVWHTNESIHRLIRLAAEWPLVAIGSSGEFDVSLPAKLLKRMRDVLHWIVDDRGHPKCKLHGLRMLNPRVFAELPLSSADSTNVARNIGIDKAWRGSYQPKSKETRASILTERIEAMNSSECFLPMRFTGEPPMIYATPYDPETLRTAGPSAPLGLEDIDTALQMFGADHLPTESRRTFLYPAQGVAVTDWVIAL